MVVTEISGAGRLVHPDLQAEGYIHLVDYRFGHPASRVPGTQYGDKKGAPIGPLFLDVMMIQELRSFPEALFFISQSLYVAGRWARLVAQGVLAGGGAHIRDYIIIQRESVNVSRGGEEQGVVGPRHKVGFSRKKDCASYTVCFFWGDGDILETELTVAGHSEGTTNTTASCTLKW